MLTAMNAVSAVAGAASGATTGANLPGAGAASFFSTDAAGAASVTPFADLITGAVSEVSQLEQQANAAVSGLMTGTGVDVHQAMIATQKADMAFELALAVRNKAVQAYQSVMGMQF